MRHGRKRTRRARVVVEIDIEIEDGVVVRLGGAHGAFGGADGAGADKDKDMDVLEASEGLAAPDESVSSALRLVDVRTNWDMDVFFSVYRGG
jgi:hypothetical protein